MKISKSILQKMIMEELKEAQVPEADELQGVPPDLMAFLSLLRDDVDGLQDAVDKITAQRTWAKKASTKRYKEE